MWFLFPWEFFIIATQEVNVFFIFITSYKRHHMSNTTYHTSYFRYLIKYAVSVSFISCLLSFFNFLHVNVSMSKMAVHGCLFLTSYVGTISSLCPLNSFTLRPHWVSTLLLFSLQGKFPLSGHLIRNTKCYKLKLKFQPTYVCYFIVVRLFRVRIMHEESTP